MSTKGHDIRRNSEAPFTLDCQNQHEESTTVLQKLNGKLEAPEFTTNASESSTRSTLDRDAGRVDQSDDPIMMNTETSSSEAGSRRSRMPKPPDGGWGWAVVFASFMIHVIADGITYTFGIFTVEFMESFNEGRGLVSFIPSILVGVTLGTGPLASSLTNRYGCRIVTIVGAILGAIGLMVSALAANLIMLYITVGIITGVGFGFIYLPAIVSVSTYFETKRSFATGIAVCGSGLGTFIFAPFTNALVTGLGWRYAIAIIGLLVFSCILFGCLFRPLTVYEEEDEVDGNEEQNGGTNAVGSGCSSVSSKGSSKTTAQTKTSAKSEKPKESEIDPLLVISNHGDMPKPDIVFDSEELQPLAVQVGVQDGKYSDISRVTLSHPVFPTSNDKRFSVLHFGSQHRIDPVDSEANLNSIPETAPKGSPGSRSRHMLKLPNQSRNYPLARKDVFYSGSLVNIPEYKQNPKLYSRNILDKDIDHSADVPAEKRVRKKSVVVSEKGDNEDEVDTLSGGNCCSDLGLPSWKTMKKMMDLSLLKDGIFMMFAVSNFLTSIGFNAPYVYTVDRALLMGIDEEAASYLLSVVGISNTLGRIVLGFISDRSFVNRLYLYNACLIVCGLSLCLSNFCYDFVTQSIYCAIFGVTSGAYVGLTSVVLVDLLGLEKLTNAFGLLLLFQGIASIIGPPIIGGLYDVIGTFDSGFYLAGATIFLSGAMLFLLPLLKQK